MSYKGMLGKQKNIMSEELMAIKHVLIIGPNKNPSVQIGVIQPFRHLKKQGVCTFNLKREDEVKKKDIAASQTVIFVRCVEPRSFRLFRRAKKMGKQTVYYIDDYFNEIPINNPIRKFYSKPSRKKTFENFLKQSDIVKVGSEYFGKYLRKKYNSNIVYFPSSVDFKRIRKVKKQERKDGIVVIGYAGSNKENHFAPVVPALLKILDHYGKSVRLEFWGYIPSAFVKHPKVSFIQTQKDYKKFIKSFAQRNWDIGLAPLENTLYTRCKTNNKFRECAACGIPGVYSDLPTYTDWVVNEKTGLIVSHTMEGWYEGIRKMIKNPSLRQNIKINARNFAQEHFNVEKCAKAWKENILKA